MREQTLLSGFAEGLHVPGEQALDIAVVYLSGYHIGIPVASPEGERTLESLPLYE